MVLCSKVAVQAHIGISQLCSPSILHQTLSGRVHLTPSLRRRISVTAGTGGPSMKGLWRSLSKSVLLTNFLRGRTGGTGFYRDYKGFGTSLSWAVHLSEIRPELRGVRNNIMYPIPKQARHRKISGNTKRRSLLILKQPNIQS